MGMGTMFTDAANLSGVATGAPLKVSDAIQKAYIEVNEEGTEAAAVTGKSSFFQCLIHALIISFCTINAIHFLTMNSC